MSSRRFGDPLRISGNSKNGLSADRDTCLELQGGLGAQTVYDPLESGLEMGL